MFYLVEMSETCLFSLPTVMISCAGWVWWGAEGLTTAWDPSG